MKQRKGNSLVVIENGRIISYELDDKLIWEVGRPSKDNMPDIKMHLPTISRQHGRFQNIGGVWFYMDKKGKNGTVYNGKHVGTGLNGKIKPIILKDGDVLIFGGGDEAVINSRTVWAMFSEKIYNDNWRVEDTKGLEELSFADGSQSTVLRNPDRGTVVKKENGIAIYMGNITYLVGDISVSGK